MSGILCVNMFGGRVAYAKRKKRTTNEGRYRLL